MAATYANERDKRSVTPHVAAMAKLLQLHEAAGHLAEYVPEVIAHPAAAHGLEQALTEAMVACLSTAGVAEDTSSQRRHALIMRKIGTRRSTQSPNEMMQSS